MEGIDLNKYLSTIPKHAYIAAIDVNPYRSDMDCFIPLIEQFHKLYGFYPKYPTADASYGSYNNYIYCEQHGMEKYMKFPMYKKETKDKKYHENPFRAVNFKVDEDGILRCPNHKAFLFSHRKAVKGNRYGRQEEIYKCEDCSGCSYAAQCLMEKANLTGEGALCSFLGINNNLHKKSGLRKTISRFFTAPK